ncbi:hypothetical protein [Stieleria varia]|nr:hypothetical protein [Stieleria varia]
MGVFVSTRCHLLLCALLSVSVGTGCQNRTSNPPPRPDRDLTYDSDWSERNADIYRFLISKLDEPTPDRIYFITTTPMSEWGDDGDWATIPEVELSANPKASQYRPANEAHLADGHVLENGTDAKAWMMWFSVKRWISETEVEVEDGVWCCPLGGGASTITYEKIDGKWKVKDYGESWVS